MIQSCQCGTIWRQSPSTLRTGQGGVAWALEAASDRLFIMWTGVIYEHHKFLTHWHDNPDNLWLSMFIYIYVCVCMCVLCECVCEHMLQATSCYAMFPFLLSFHYSIFVLVVSIDLIVPQLELIFTESQPGQTCLQQKRRIRNSEYDAYISRLCVVHCAIEILMFF